MSIRDGLRFERHSLIWAAGILAASAGFFLLDTRPQMAKARGLSETLLDQRADLAARFESAEALARAETETAALAVQLGDMDARIPSQPLLGNFLEDLARVAQKRELQSEVIQPGQPARLSKVDALPIAVHVRGSFANIHGLLRDVENMPRLTRIDRFKVTTDDQHPGIVNAEMNLRIFYRGPEEAKPG